MVTEMVIKYEKSCMNVREIPCVIYAIIYTDKHIEDSDQWKLNQYLIYFLTLIK